MILKPGNAPKIENVRSITLPSCLGKLFEYLITTLLQHYLKDNDLIPGTMSGPTYPHKTSYYELRKMSSTLQFKQHMSFWRWTSREPSTTWALRPYSKNSAP